MGVSAPFNIFSSFPPLGYKCPKGFIICDRAIDFHLVSWECAAGGTLSSSVGSGLYGKKCFLQFLKFLEFLKFLVDPSPIMQ